MIEVFEVFEVLCHFTTFPVELSWVEAELGKNATQPQLNGFEGWTRLKLVFLYPWCYLQALLQKSMISLEVAVDLK